MRKNNLPLISIITPSYNQGEFLEHTIKSVISQNYPNLEYIIIDGGSTDNSVEIIKKYEDRITYWVSEKDKGQSDAINKGYKLVTGDIVTWLNSDDVFIAETLQTVADFFMRNANYEAVSGDLINIDAEGKELLNKKLINLHYIEMLFSSISVPQPATFYRKSALDKTGPIDLGLNFNMDLDFFIRMKKAGVKFGRINKPLAKFRIHSGSKTVTEFTNKVEKANYIIKSKHLGRKFKGEEENILLKFLRFFFRLEIYLRKLVLRREIIPFKYTKIVKNSQSIL